MPSSNAPFPNHPSQDPHAGITSASTVGPASNDNPSADIRLDQYYTRPDVAAALYRVCREHFHPSMFRMVEPSAGDGSFFRLLPPGSLGFDLMPRYPGIRKADFLSTTLPADRPLAVVGNPPFGRNASMAVRFFNQAASQASVIAFVMPRSVRKASVENRLDRSFHLLREVDVPRDAFVFRGRPFHVPAVFQIWVRLGTPRQLRRVETTHPDFEFTTPDVADFAIQRVGARAGRIHYDFARSPSAHYFIRGGVGLVAMIGQLDFATAAADVAGNPSLSKAEIVSLYEALLAKRAGCRA